MERSKVKQFFKKQRKSSTFKKIAFNRNIELFNKTSTIMAKNIYCDISTVYSFRLDTMDNFEANLL